MVLCLSLLYDHIKKNQKKPKKHANQAYPKSCKSSPMLLQFVNSWNENISRTHGLFIFSILFSSLQFADLATTNLIFKSHE